MAFSMLPNEVQTMHFFKKLFIGIGFFYGFLFFETLEWAHSISGTKTHSHHRCGGFWRTAQKYLIFRWIYDGLCMGRSRVAKKHYRSAKGTFSQPEAPARNKKTAAEPVKPKPKTENTTARTAPSVSKKEPVQKQKSDSTTIPKAKELSSSAAPVKKNNSAPAKKAAPSAAKSNELPLPEISPAPVQKEDAEALRQKKLSALRSELREQICAIHADIPLSAQNHNAAEQQLHMLLYKTDVPACDLDAALSALRVLRREQKAEYQGAPFADAFLVSLVLADEESDRACIVDVGTTGISYVIPWSSIPNELQPLLRRYIAQANGKLLGYCEEELCVPENNKMVVELYLSQQEPHSARIFF